MFGSGMLLRAGDWVEVRSKEEILRSLDSEGRLDRLPFMPQMFAYCGRRFRVSKRAHKTCDTVTGTGGRSLPGGIHLENLRCDGQAYGGCQAACLIFWKEAWLKPVDDGTVPQAAGMAGSLPASGSLTTQGSRRQTGCTEETVRRRTLARDQPASGGPKYSCQATDLPIFTDPLPWWKMTQYVEDYTSGNVPFSRLVTGFIYASYYRLSRPGRNPLRAPFRWLYDRVTGLWGGVPFPRYGGIVPVGQPQPTATLDLQPGEWVRVKSYAEILATIGRNNKNRGLFFDAEMVPYCGQTFRVRARVTRFIGEATGTMVTLKTPALILENVWCRSHYSDRRMLCPRSIYSWWREVWLERVSPETVTELDGACRAAKTSRLSTSCDA
jgi:hypothetical protein